MLRSAYKSAPFIWRRRVRDTARKASTTPFPIQKVELYGFEDYGLEKVEEELSSTVETTEEELLHAYERMFTIRTLEVASRKMYTSREILGFCHLYDGQEAILVGMNKVLTVQDALVTGYRDHGFALERGCSPRAVFAELMGKATGCSKGKGGSMHMYAPEQAYYGGNGIVGAQVPIAAGLAYANKQLGKDAISVGFYGDGAANQGQLFEAMNMAALWKLPCLFACENNHYGMGTTASRSSASTDYYTRGQYIPGIRLDGMDYLSVRHVTEWAKKYILEHGPLVLEFDAYRYGGHSMSDPGTSYRTRDEVKSVKQSRDPILQTKNRLLEMDASLEETLKTMEKRIKKELDDAVKEARGDPFPESQEVYTDIMASDIPVRGVSIDQSYKMRRLE